MLSLLDSTVSYLKILLLSTAGGFFMKIATHLFIIFFLILTGFNYSSGADNEEIFMDEGIKQASLGNYREAAVLFDKAIAVNPQNAVAWRSKAAALFFMGQYEASLKSVEKSIDVDPNDYDAWQGKGNCLQMLKRYNEALVAYNKSIEINPNYSSAWISKGCILASLKNYKEALIALNKGIELFKCDLKNLPPDTLLLKGLSQLMLNKYQDSIKTFDQAISYHPNDYRSFCSKGIALSSLGDKKSADDAFNHAQRISGRADVCVQNPVP
jgi:tetratricopeptide (TPR) repeat protein